MISCTPGGRTAAISPCMPSRTRHSISICSGSRENGTAASPSASAAAASSSAEPPPDRRRGTPPAAPPSPVGSSRHASGVPGMFQAAAISVGATISSVAVAPAATSRPTAPRRASIEAKRTQRDRGVRPQRDRLELGLGDERERPLRADDEPAEDLEGLIGIQERAQPVAGRVLDLELPSHPFGELRDRPAARRAAPPTRPPAPAPPARTAPRHRAPRYRSPRHWRARASSPVRSGRSPAARRSASRRSCWRSPRRRRRCRCSPDRVPACARDRASMRFARPSTTPGWRRTRAPPSSTRLRLQWRRTSTSTESLWACPFSDVPPARKVSGVPVRRAHASSATTSPTPQGRRPRCGILR